MTALNSTVEVKDTVLKPFKQLCETHKLQFFVVLQSSLQPKHRIWTSSSQLQNLCGNLIFEFATYVSTSEDSPLTNISSNGDDDFNAGINGPLVEFPKTESNDQYELKVDSESEHVSALADVSVPPTALTQELLQLEVDDMEHSVSPPSHALHSSINREGDEARMAKAAPDYRRDTLRIEDGEDDDCDDNDDVLLPEEEIHADDQTRPGKEAVASSVEEQSFHYENEREKRGEDGASGMAGDKRDANDGDECVAEPDKNILVERVEGDCIPETNENFFDGCVEDADENRNGRSTYLLLAKDQADSADGKFPLSDDRPKNLFFALPNEMEEDPDAHYLDDDLEIIPTSTHQSRSIDPSLSASGYECTLSEMTQDSFEEERRISLLDDASPTIWRVHEFENPLRSSTVRRLFADRLVNSGFGFYVPDREHLPLILAIIKLKNPYCAFNSERMCRYGENCKILSARA